MEDIVNIETFIQHLTYYIKIGIYINKGTDKDTILERCIKLYNKYKTIEGSKDDITDEDEIFVRKCLKRLNLVLKIDSEGNPIDIRTKENQLKMAYFEGHPSLINNDLPGMLEYATKHNITILSEIPLMFILRESKYQELLWQYTRSLFYISQLLITRVSPDADPNDKFIIAKKQIFDHSLEQFGEILETITETEEKIKLNQVLTVDKFLNSNLIKINGKKVSEAREEVKEIFKKKGLGVDNSMTKMIDLISDKLTNINSGNGNILQNMFGIAQSVAMEMKSDLENDPEKFQSTIGDITEVFQEAIDDSDKNGQAVPSELKNMFNTILSASGVNGEGKEVSEEEITKNLDSIVEANGLNKEDFYDAIRSNNGEIDVNKLESLLANLK